MHPTAMGQAATNKDHPEPEGVLMLTGRRRKYIIHKRKPYTRTVTKQSHPIGRKQLSHGLALTRLEAFHLHSIMRQGWEWEWLRTPGQPVLPSLRNPIGSPPQ